MKKHIALGLLASSLVLAGCCSTSHSNRLEYQEVGSIEEVNKLAAQGWRVESFSVTALPSGQSHYYLLKRFKK